MPTIRLTKKQTQAIDFLQDNVTREIAYGGAAGGAKSFLGCYWQLKQRLKYKGTRGLIGRARFKTLKDTTLKTLLEVHKLTGLKRGAHWELTGANDKENPNSVVYFNGSVILLRDLFDYPSDPDFDELGSLEITDAFVDECAQVGSKARETILTRIRFKHSEHGLIPKILYASNPTKNWLYSDFYQPNREGRLRSDRAFVQAFVTDNPHVDRSYIQTLDSLPEGAQKERLRWGNWEYDDDPSALIDYEAILRAFEGKGQPGKGAISVDYARFGSDKTVLTKWNGYQAKVKKYKGLSVPDAVKVIKQAQNEMRIPSSRIVIDEDGVGGGVVDLIPGCKGFVNNSRAVGDENFDNLKSQCYFKLADAINKGMVSIDCDSEDKEDIKQELEWVKQKSVDTDQKKGIIPKDKVKEKIGRSPDFSDSLAMRFYFDVAKVGGVKRAKGF